MSAKVNNIFDFCNDSCEKSTFQSDEMDFSELLPITEKNGKLLINARDLHHVLSVGKDFSNWIKDRIERCDLIKDIDYIIIEYDYRGNVICSTYANSGESEYQRVAKRDYGLTSSAAKEISMVENNEIGKKVRRYFIKCEEMVKKPYVPQTLQEALRAYADALDRKEQAEKEARMLRMINEEQKTESRLL